MIFLKLLLFLSFFCYSKSQFEVTEPFEEVESISRTKLIKYGVYRFKWEYQRLNDKGQPKGNLRTGYLDANSKRATDNLFIDRDGAASSSTEWLLIPGFKGSIGQRFYFYLMPVQEFLSGSHKVLSSHWASEESFLLPRGKDYLHPEDNFGRWETRQLYDILYHNSEENLVQLLPVIYMCLNCTEFDPSSLSDGEDRLSLRCYDTKEITDRCDWRVSKRMHPLPGSPHELTLSVPHEWSNFRMIPVVDDTGQIKRYNPDKFLNEVPTISPTVPPSPEISTPQPTPKPTLAVTSEPTIPPTIGGDPITIPPAPSTPIATPNPTAGIPIGIPPTPRPTLPTTAPTTSLGETVTDVILIYYYVGGGVFLVFILFVLRRLCNSATNASVEPFYDNQNGEWFYSEQVS